MPLLLMCAGAGIASLLRWGWPVHASSGLRFATALAALAILQLIPLPPGLLAIISPGSFSYYADWLLVPLRDWRPISVSPPDTQRALLFVIALGLYHSALARHFRTGIWRRRLIFTIVGTALLSTIVGLVQEAAGVTHIYGLWQPTYSAAIFGPYVNKNHYAGYVAMAIPLTFALASRSLRTLIHAWQTRRRRARWLILGEPEGVGAIRWVGVGLVLLLGLLAARSRGGLLAVLASAAALPMAMRRRAVSGGLVVGSLLLALSWVGTEQLQGTIDRPGIHEGRIDAWRDSMRMAPRFPLFGSGLNTFATAYPRFQRVDRGAWWGEAHNDYLQMLLDTGVAGLLLVGAFLASLLRRAWFAARNGSIEAGILGCLVASCAHATVDFNWQIPANALTFVAIASLVADERAAVSGASEGGLLESSMQRRSGADS